MSAETNTVQRELVSFREVVAAAQMLQAKIESLAQARGDAVTQGLEPIPGAPAPLIRALTRFIERVNAPPEPSDREKRVIELRANVERARGALAAMKQSPANDHAAQQRRAEVEMWLKHDEAELKKISN